MIDQPDARALCARLQCMTALRHVRQVPAVAALERLALEAARERVDTEAFAQAYCAAYGAWMDCAARGLSGFGQAALEAVLFEESAFASLCAARDERELPYSVLRAGARDLAALGDLTRLEPADLLALAAHGGADQAAFEFLPAWELETPRPDADPRLHGLELSAQGVSALAAFFRRHGTGLFARYPGCTWVGESERYPLGLRGIDQPDPIRLEDMVLYEQQRGALVENTRLLLAGLPAANVLLYGDKGTGKSATVKALLTTFFTQGLRIVEVPLASLTHLPSVFALLRRQPGKFIVFVDDLAFSDSCPEYTALKTVLEGGLEARPANVVVYATSNRRNIVRQRFSERQDDVNERDTLEEKFSLSDRFDIRLTFAAPSQDEYLQIVRALMAARGLCLPWDDVRPQAIAWTVSHNGCSPRVARQFVDHLGARAASSASQ